MMVAIATAVLGAATAQVVHEVEVAEMARAVGEAGVTLVAALVVAAAAFPSPLRPMMLPSC